MHITLKFDSQLEREVLDLLDFDTSALKNLETKGYERKEIEKVVKSFDTLWEILLKTTRTPFEVGEGITTDNLDKYRHRIG